MKKYFFLRHFLFKKIFGFWGIQQTAAFDLLFAREAKPFLGLRPNFQDPEVNKSYIDDNNKWTHFETIFSYNHEIILEPDYLYGITSFNKLFEPTITDKSIFPSAPRFLLSYFKTRIKFNEAILFDGSIGRNYFHFFVDVVNQLWLFEKIKNFEKLPIIIGESTFNTKYFQFFFYHERFKGLNWIIQKKGEYIVVEKIHILRPMPYDKRYFEQTKTLVLGAQREPPIKNKKVFLNRNSTSGRHIENMNELKHILNKYSFEIVDTEGMLLPEQARLFQSIKYLIGIHGAGNTNLIFADKTVRFLELMPSDRITSHYYWLSIALEIEYYDVITGGKLPPKDGIRHKGFYLDPKKLDDAIKRLLESYDEPQVPDSL